MPIKEGNQVSVTYTGTFEDGTVFDSSEKHEGEPLVLIAGAGMIIPGFDAAIIGMEKDQQKEITLQPKDAYGDYDPKAIQKIPKSKFPKDFDPKEGQLLQLGTPDGDRFIAKVVKIEKDGITLDMNHELAGKILKFKFKIVEYGEPDERWEHSCGPGCGDSCGSSCGDSCGHNHDEE